MKNQNFMLKVTNAKKADIKKALTEAGIQVRSLTEVFSEETDKEEDAGQKGEG